MLEDKLIENRQVMLTQGDAQRLEELAQSQNRKISEMMRILLLESLERWEKSAPGRRRRKP
jgi:hypothetical protein